MALRHRPEHVSPLLSVLQSLSAVYTRKSRFLGWAAVPFPARPLLSPATTIQQAPQVLSILDYWPVPEYQMPLHKLLRPPGAPASHPRGQRGPQTHSFVKIVQIVLFLSGLPSITTQRHGLFLDPDDLLTFSYNILCLFLLLDDGLFEASYSAQSCHFLGASWCFACMGYTCQTSPL